MYSRKRVVGNGQRSKERRPSVLAFFLREMGKPWSVLSRGVTQFSQDLFECSVKNRMYKTKVGEEIS